MSTILKALEKRRTEQEVGSDAEAILERNAAYREMARQRASAKGPRWALVLVGISFALIVVSAAATAFLWISWKSRSNAAAEKPAAAAKSVLPVSTVTPPPARTPRAEAEEKPVLHESVRLRTRPMFPSPSAAQSPGIYAAGPQPSAGGPAAPIVTPQPIFILPAQVLVGRSEGMADGSRDTRGTTATASGQTPRHPKEFLHVSGIVKGSEKPMALINDRIVVVGDVVEGVKILAIDDTSRVRVEYQGKQYDLEIP